MKNLASVFSLSALLLGTSTIAGLAQSGPVATACKSDIAKTCAGLPHDGSVRTCLQNNYDKVSAGCKKALDTTGGGRRLGPGRAR